MCFLQKGIEKLQLHMTDHGIYLDSFILCFSTSESLFLIIEDIKSILFVSCSI